MAYLAGNPLLTVSRQTWEGIATAGQTVISIPGGVVPGMSDVYVGGACLSKGDFDDSSGSGIVLTKPMSLGTQYRVVTFAPGANMQQASVNALSGNRNLLIDGQFEQWTNTNVALPVSAGYVGPTMYYVAAGTGGAGSVAKGVFTGTPVGWSAPAPAWLSFAQTTANTGGGLLMQNVESVRTLSGKSATFSLNMWVSSGTLTIGSVIARQSFGSGGSPSAVVVADKAVNWVVGTSSKKFSVRLDYPDIAGKTLGTAGNDLIQIGLWLPANVTYTLNTGQWQLEESSPNSSSDINGQGGAPSPFEYRGFQAELARVRRLYQPLFDMFVSGNAGAGAAVYTDVVLPMPMRGVPAAALANTPTYSNASGLSVNAADGNRLRQQITLTAAGYGYAFGQNWALDARL